MIFAYAYSDLTSMNNQGSLLFGKKGKDKADISQAAEDVLEVFERVRDKIMNV